MNSSKNKVLLFLVGILLLTNIVMLVFFVGKKEPEKPRSGRTDRSSAVREFLKDSIGFNDQQLSQYDQLRQQNREAMRPLFEDLGNAKLSYYRYVNQPNADSASQIAATAIGEKQKTLDMAFFRHFRQVRALCTAEQLPKYDSLVVNIIQKMVAPPHRGDHKQRKQPKEEKN
jgi:hypothetical protein